MQITELDKLYVGCNNDGFNILIFAHDKESAQKVAESYFFDSEMSLKNVTVFPFTSTDIDFDCDYVVSESDLDTEISRVTVAFNNEIGNLESSYTIACKTDKNQLLTTVNNCLDFAYQREDIKDAEEAKDVSCLSKEAIALLNIAACKNESFSNICSDNFYLTLENIFTLLGLYWAKNSSDGFDIVKNW